jgi:uncharacterized protein YqjF (DUF2071 family)/predicted DCC family thiol-disulfide oxidoreductase YuxK
VPFLTASWRNLIVVNYEVDPALLAPYVPLGCELDTHEGKAFVSLVAFQFLDNAFLGLLPTVPARDFEEINLRFYVRRVVDGETRRAVAFIKEVVPSNLIAVPARLLYNEPYVKHPTEFRQQGNELAYRWHAEGAVHQIKVRTKGELLPLVPDSHEHFILEHYWGYTSQVDGSTCEYRVEHPSWRFQRVATCEVSASIAEYYGEPFRNVLSGTPVSAFVAEGSPISVSTPRFFRGRLDMTAAPADGAKGWVLYDGACGFCTWWIPLWRKTIRRTGFDIAAVQDKWVRALLPLPPGELNRDIRLLMRDGTLINGADAYIAGMKKVWWSSPLGFLLALPVLRWLTWRFYELFNRNRFLVSRVCRLPAQTDNELP